MLDQFRRRDRRSVVVAYETMLGRQPESDAVVDGYARLGLERTLRSIAGSPEFQAQRQGSPFFHYNASFDARATIVRHARVDLAPHPDYLTNFLGVRIDPKFLPLILEGRAGQVEEVPIPANWHADIAEWAAVLRSVDLARGTFAMAELGCGWGCWMNNAGVAARASGLEVQLIGIEGDEGHVGFARETCAANGFAPEQVTLHHGVVAASSGIALFPRQDKAGEQWGLEPVFDATDDERAAAVTSGRFDALPTISLEDVLDWRPSSTSSTSTSRAARPTSSSRAVLCSTRARLTSSIGTHSREIEGRLFSQLLERHWRLEIERPAILDLSGDAPTTVVDGVQGWRNLSLTPE